MPTTASKSPSPQPKSSTDRAKNSSSIAPSRWHHRSQLRRWRLHLRCQPGRRHLLRHRPGISPSPRWRRHLTDAQAEALLNALEYKNTSDNHIGKSRLRSPRHCSNSSPATSTLASFTASVAGTNDAPTISRAPPQHHSGSNLDIGGSVSLADGNPDATVQISVTTAEILDGSSEKLVINSALSGGTIDLNFDDGDSISDVSLGGVTSPSPLPNLTSPKMAAALTDAQAEALLSASNTKTSRQSLRIGKFVSISASPTLPSRHKHPRLLHRLRRRHQ